MGRAAAADGASAPPRGPFAVDQDRALAELELAWSEGGYHGFTAAGGTWCAIAAARRCQSSRSSGSSGTGPKAVTAQSGACSAAGSPMRSLRASISAAI